MGLARRVGVWPTRWRWLHAVARLIKKEKRRCFVQTIHKNNKLCQTFAAERSIEIDTFGGA
jgi:hypothetical protein